MPQGDGVALAPAEKIGNSHRLPRRACRGIMGHGSGGLLSPRLQLCPSRCSSTGAGPFLFAHCCTTAFRLSVSSISHNAATFTRKRFPERTPGHLPCATSCRKWCSLVIPVAAVCLIVLNSGMIAPPREEIFDTRKNRLHFVLYRVIV